MPFLADEGTDSVVVMFQGPRVNSSGIDKVRTQRNEKHCCVAVVRMDLTSKELPSTENNCCITLQQMKKALEFIQLPKHSPVYGEIQNSSSTELYAIYGSMPAKGMIYNLKCDPVFDCGAGALMPHLFSPHGHVLRLAGFKNLANKCNHGMLKHTNLFLTQQPLILYILLGAQMGSTF